MEFLVTPTSKISPPFKDTSVSLSASILIYFWNKRSNDKWKTLQWPSSGWVLQRSYFLQSAAMSSKNMVKCASVFKWNIDLRSFENRRWHSDRILTVHYFSFEAWNWFSACGWFVDLAGRLLLLRSQAWCLFPVWFGSQPQSAGHRFLLKATKPVIWPRRDDDLAISERILTSLLESPKKQVISQDSQFLTSLLQLPTATLILYLREAHLSDDLVWRP